MSVKTSPDPPRSALAAPDAALKALAAGEAITKVFHHAKFDLAFLAHVGSGGEPL